MMLDIVPAIAQKDDLKIVEVKSHEVKHLITEKHYAKRMPSVSYAFALVQDGRIVGALTVGKPASPPLCVGIAGPEWSPQIYELNRLIITENESKNVLSWFVGSVLKSLSNTPIVIVSFADDGVGHKGYVYQATNWVYTGMTAERTDKYMPGNKHPRHYTEEFAHLRKLRTSKHRYVYVPNRKLRKRFFNDLRYEILPYPKGDNRRYRLGDLVEPRVFDKSTGLFVSAD